MHPAIPILMYHSVDRDCSPGYRRWTVTPEQLADHLAVLRDRGRKAITISELARQMREGRLDQNAVAITFDDGLADFLLGAVPVLEQFAAASTLFVTTGYVGGTARWLAELGEGARPMLSWGDLTELTQRNVEIGAHTHTHPQLDLLLPGRARREIQLSKALLERHLEQAVLSFAYPHGYSTPAVRRIVEEAGFDAACRVADGLLRPDETPYSISRLIVTPEWSVPRLEAVLDGADVAIGRAPDQLSMKAWRLYRGVCAMLAGRLPGTVREAPEIWSPTAQAGDQRPVRTALGPGADV